MAGRISTQEMASATRDELKRELQLSRAGKPTEGGHKQSMDEHLHSAEDIAIRYATDLTAGLRSSKIDELLVQYGHNELTPPKTRHVLLLFMDNMTGFFSLLLWGAAILCFIGYALDPEQPENVNFFSTTSHATSHNHTRKKQQKQSQPPTQNTHHNL